VAAWLGSIVSAPLLAIQKNELANSVYAFHKPFCHQMVKRSFCFFNNGTDTWLGDCVPDNKTIIGPINPATGRPHTTIVENATGYAFAEDARDVSFYLAMLIGTFVFPFVRKIDETKTPHPLWLLIAVAPMGIDGTTQLIGLRESTNYLRFVTGSIAGFVVPFYFFPILNQLFLGKEKMQEKTEKK
jgi:uncharacterized membrane protein